LAQASSGGSRVRPAPRAFPEAGPMGPMGRVHQAQRSSSCGGGARGGLSRPGAPRLPSPLLVLLAGVVASPRAAALGVGAGANPIRRVVTMLQMMQTKVAAEGEKEKKLFERFMCHCDSGGEGLRQSLAAAETKLPQLESSTKEATAEEERLKGDVVQAKSERLEAKSALSEAKSLRENEAKAFAKESSQTSANIQALGKAITSLEKGTASSFLQTGAAALLRQLTVTTNMGATDRDLLSSFLSQGEVGGYAPQSGEITGMLAEMKDNMEKELKDMLAQEEKARQEYAEMSKAKEEQVDALTKQIEAKTGRAGEVASELVNLKNDYDDTSDALAEDKVFLADLEKSCKLRTTEWADRQTLRSEELSSIAEAIRVLNNDESLDLFKKTLPSPSAPSFIQLRSGRSPSRQQRALRLLGESSQRGGAQDPRVALLTRALRSKRGNFDKVISMVDDMSALLVKEQDDDDKKKTYCNTELDQAEDQKKELDLDITDLGKNVADGKSRIEGLETEIAALGDGIKALDKGVAEATSQRKEEHAAYVQSQRESTAARELLRIAKNVLNKFYNPAQYQAPAAPELSEEDRITVNLGGSLGPTAAPGGIANTGVVALQAGEGEEAAPPPAPELYGAYEKSSQESGGVIAMIDLLIQDLAKDMQEAEVEEKNGQADYEKSTADATAKRTADAKAIAEKEGVKADLEARLHKLGHEMTAKGKEAASVAKYITTLHSECDWLVANYEVRKEARANEAESLQGAKAILSGADYSLVQSPSRRVALHRA